MDIFLEGLCYLQRTNALQKNRDKNICNQILELAEYMGVVGDITCNSTIIMQ